jgi:hypothetical protein
MGGGPKAGGRPEQVMLVSDPPGATAYVVLYDDWLKMPHENLNAPQLARYEVTAGQTPVTVKLKPYSYIFVAEEGGRWAVSDRFTPGTDKSVQVRIK